MGEADVFSGLNDRVALITGGSRGIGLAIGRALASRGCHVAVLARTASAVETAAEQIAALGVKALPVVADAGQPAQIRQAVAKVVAELGRIDILVNGASVPPPLRSLLECDEGAWDRAMTVNLKSYFLFSQLAIRDMIPRRWGRVINITSSTGLKARKGMAEYGVSKAAEIMLTREFAVEVGEYGITVNAIAPVLTRTDFSAHQWENPKELEAVISRQAIPRLAEVEDVVGAALLLASDAGRMITGHTLIVDGGLLA